MTALNRNNDTTLQAAKDKAYMSENQAQKLPLQDLQVAGGEHFHFKSL
jgi:hypothetical protein